MSRNSLAALACGIASLALAGAARAEAPADPLQDAGVARIRDAFKVDGIALFDAHSLHAARMGICAPSIFAGLKWCVSGTAEVKQGAAAYMKTTGYNVDGAGRIVYAISTRRSYPLKRAEFDGIIRAIGERFGAAAAVHAFKKTGEEGGSVDSLIAVWGGLRLVHLTEPEYAVVEGGGSLKRGHLVDHRFNLVVSAQQREPVYRLEGDAGFILHVMATSPDRADVIARAIYQPVFLPPPGQPSAEADNPLVTETVRRPTAAAPAPGPRTGRIGNGRGLAAERLLREEAERKATEEKAAREEAERKAEDARRALEAESRRLAAERKAAEERAKKAASELEAKEERRLEEEAERKSAEERARRAEAERRALEEQRRKDEADRKLAEGMARHAEAKRAEAERRALEERRRKEEVEREVAAERRAREERAKREEAERKAAEAAEAKRARDLRQRAEQRSERKTADASAPRPDPERAPGQGRGEADDPAAERRAEAERLRRERADRPEAWRRLAADAAKAAGAIWSFAETHDRVADERVLRSQTIFGGADSAERLAVEVTFECTIIGRDRRLRAFARGFDRKAGTGIAFRTEGEGNFGVRTRFRLDGQAAQDGLLFRDRQDDIASILELPMTAADTGKHAPRAAVWLRHYAAALEFNLVAGTVAATVAPHADNLRRVLEACAE